jgi:hypothetical protein
LWTSGSFYCSNATGQNAPVNGHAFTGICYSSDPPAIPPANLNLVVEARDQSDTMVPGRVYVRQKKAGVWDPVGWTVASNDKLDNTGGILTGPISITTATPFLLLDKAASGTNAYVAGATATKNRWSVIVGDNTAETATDGVGSNFLITRHNNAGTAVDTPININRQTGIVLVNGQAKVSVGGDTMTGPLVLPLAAPTLATHAANKNYVDTAPRVVASQAGSYTLVLADQGKVVMMSSASAITLTVPLNSAAAFPIGTQIDVAQGSTGAVSIAPAGGVTLNSEDSRRKLRSPFATATLLKTALDTWLLTGSLIP